MTRVQLAKHPAGWLSGITAACCGGFMLQVRADTARPADEQRLELFGDFRLRLEDNSGDRDASATQRMTLRTRAGARYALLDALTVGTRVIMANAGQLRSAHQAASDLYEDRRFILDQAYVSFDRGAVSLVVGRFPNPFLKTEYQLVWDNDFTPQGIAASYQFNSGRHDLPALRLTALHYVMEAGPVGRNSSLSAAQVLSTTISDTRRLQLAVGYYDYAFEGFPNVESDQFRGNLLADDGSYLSDFNLLDLVAGVHCQPFGTAWPLEVVINHVRNLGAATAADTAFAADFFAGRLDGPGDWRVNYTFSRAETDAVFTAISQDNTRLASNYRQHSFGVEYVPHRDVVLSASWYHYRPERAGDAGDHEPSDWLDRVRLNFNIHF